MKITLILGSPRLEASSSKLAQSALEVFADKKPEVHQFVLNDLNFKGCQGCGSCKGKTETCVIKDDLAKALAMAADSDLVVLASPVYIGAVTAQLKAFIDRSYCWYKPDFHSNKQPSRLNPGKKLFFILTQGNPEKSAYQDEVVRYLEYFGSHGFKTGYFIAHGLSSSDVAKTNPDYVKKAKEAIAQL
jgi:multimeric flavodoxin WrbA